MTFMITVLVAMPLSVIIANLAQPYSDTWQHLVDTVLADYVKNSLTLMLGVAVGTFILGTSTAWLTSMCRFPGRRLFEWALLLPMAMPAYIIAYTYTGMLEFAGPIQSALRATFNWRYNDYWFPEVRSMGGAICMLSLVLYPYVYLIVRASFLQQSHALLEVSRSLGNGPWQTFWRAALPCARPAIVAGMTLALMETLADYGTVQYFGINTFTTGIFRTWFGMGDLTAAAQLSSMLLIFIATLILVERYSRKRMRFHNATAVQKRLPRLPISGLLALSCTLWCALPLCLGFVVPAGQLLIWATTTWQANIDDGFVALVINSFGLAAVSSLLCLIIAVILCFSLRLSNNGRFTSFMTRTASMGYAVPGTVIAVGVLIALAYIDGQLDTWLQASFNVSSGLLFSGTLFAVIFAYLVRFLSVAIQTLDSGYSKIRHSIDDSARTLGHQPFMVLNKIHLPMLKSSIIAALLLVFVDVLKELPTTLILRPFNFNTLAVRAYELASDERLIDAATPSLAIVIVGLIPVLLLSRTISQQQDNL